MLTQKGFIVEVMPLGQFNLVFFSHTVFRFSPLDGFRSRGLYYKMVFYRFELLGKTKSTINPHRWQFSQQRLVNYLDQMSIQTLSLTGTHLRGFSLTIGVSNPNKEHNKRGSPLKLQGGEVHLDLMTLWLTKGGEDSHWWPILCRNTRIKTEMTTDLMLRNLTVYTIPPK